MSKKIKVVLVSNISGTGRFGDVLDVPPGFARNYLLPKKLARLATPATLTALKSRIEKRVAEDRKFKDEAAQVQVRLGGEVFEISARAMDDGKLFGSVTESDIAEELKRRGYAVRKNQVLLDSHIKSVGEYDVPVRLHHDVSSKVKIKVVKA